MADPVSAMVLGVLQVGVPVALAALPGLWKQIVTILKRIPTMTKDSSNDTNLVCIKTILDTLEQVPDLHIELSHNQPLLNKIKLKAEALEEALSQKNSQHRKTFQFWKYFLEPKTRIVQDIKDIAWMMQLLDLNIRMHQYHGKPKQYAANGSVDAYQRNLENLKKDLLAKLKEDDLSPVIVKSSKHFWDSMKISSTYSKIHYHFDLQSPDDVDYPKTLTVSRGVRDCIELMLKWLRDLKDTNKGQDSSLVVGVAFFELFTETLPYVLKEHLTCSRHITKNLQNAKQFHTNLCFWRSFSTSGEFTSFQGDNGLKLEKEDRAKLDLRNTLWETWEDVQKKTEEIISELQGDNPSLAGVGGRTLAPSRTSEFSEYPISHIGLNTNSTNIALLEAHASKCLAKISITCPICGFNLDHLSNADKTLHANNCTDNYEPWTH